MGRDKSHSEYNYSMISESCPFCAIANGQSPAWLIYTTPETICFLPRNPETYAHTLIAPRQHYPDIYTLPEPSLAALMAAFQKLAFHYRDRLGAAGVNLLHASGTAAGQSVPHFHLHLIPRFAQDGLNAWPAFPPARFDLDEMFTRLKLDK